MTDAPYDLRRLKTPVLSGWLLTVFVWIAESWLFTIVGKKLMRDSGIPQASTRTQCPACMPACVRDVLTEDAGIPRFLRILTYRTSRRCIRTWTTRCRQPTKIASHWTPRMQQRGSPPPSRPCAVCSCMWGFE